MTATLLPTSACRTRLRQHAQRLAQTEIQFIPNRAFLDKHADLDITSENELVCPKSNRDEQAPAGLPAHLARLCQLRLLTADEESRLFRRMNYVKFRANAIRVRLDLDQPDTDAVDQVDRLLDEARLIQHRIVQANVRLVISVVKKFVTSQHSFDDLLSEGIHSLLHAVDKFDYGRGFRFSTYAFRAISRNIHRKINDSRIESARYATAEDAVLEAANDGHSSSTHDAAWERLRHLLFTFMERLDRREQFIVRSRYALGGHRKVRTFQSLADHLGVSKERVRQLEQRAVNKLKRYASQVTMDEFGAAFI